MKTGAPSNQTNLALGIEHLQKAISLARRGRDEFFDETEDVLSIAVEAELRKAFESLNRLGKSFFTANPRISRERIHAIRELLTHEYAEVNRELIWGIVTDDAPMFLSRLGKASLPKGE